MPQSIGVSKGTHVPTNEQLQRQLGYCPVRFVHLPANNAAYVMRQCMGCGRRLRFAPLPGISCVIRCAVCGEETSWVLREPTL